MTLASSSRRAQALNQQTFEAFLKERPKVIVLLGPGSSPDTFLPGIIGHFAADLGDGVAFGAFDTSALLYAPWPLKFVGTLWAASPLSAPDGYYLFVGGKARAFHPGIDPSAALGALGTLGVAALVSLVFDSTKPLTAVATTVNDTYAKEIITFFERILAPPPVQQVPIDWSTFDWSKLSEGLKPKKFAHDLFVRVQAAHDEIKAMRGWE